MILSKENLPYEEKCVNGIRCIAQNLKPKCSLAYDFAIL